MSRRRFFLALAVIAADQLTKVWARSLSAPLVLLPGLFQARHTENTGIAFSLLSGAPWLVTLLTAALILAALGTNMKNFTKEDESKRFIQLFIYSAVGLLVIAVVSGLFYNILANLIHG